MSDHSWKQRKNIFDGGGGRDCCQNLSSPSLEWGQKGEKKDEEKKDLGKGGAERKKGSKLHLDQMLLRMSNTEEWGRKWENWNVRPLL